MTRSGGSVEGVLLGYAASNGLAAIMAAWLAGTRLTARPELVLLRSAWTIGAPVTLGSVAESGLYLGARYLLGAFGTPQQLGVFSFCLDLAQRLVGFPVNAASYVFVPQAFRHAGDGDGARFRRVLFHGAGAALVLALSSVAALMLLRAIAPQTSLIAGPFDPWTFAVVSVAVILNRVKKLVLDPFAVRAGLTLVIALGYCVGAVAAGIFAAAVNAASGAQAMSFAYLVGHAVAATVPLIALRREMLPSSASRCSPNSTSTKRSGLRRASTGA
jgi:hypothetical protein